MKAILHGREEQFDWVVVWRVQWQEFTPHATGREVSFIVIKYIEAENLYCDSMRWRMSGCLWMQQLSMTMTELGTGNGCIWSRVRSMNFWNVAVSNAPSIMSQWRTPCSRDNAGRVKYLECINHINLSDAVACWMIVICLPFPTTKEGLPHRFHPSYGPCPTPIGCSTVDSTLVNKYKLIWLVCPYPSSKYGLFLSASFKGYTSKLIICQT